MTSDSSSPEPRRDAAEHLDDLMVSAVVDGDAPTGTHQHLRSCGPCRERVAAVRAAVGAVGTPPPPPTERARREAVAAAVAAGTRGSRNASWPWMGGMAAALAAVVGLASLLLVGPGSGDDATTGAAMPDDAEELVIAADPADVVDGGDLGSLDATSRLRQPVRAALATGGEAPPPAPRDRTATDEDGGADAGASPFAESAPTPDGTCAAALDELGLGLGALRYRAVATFDGAPAVVYGFALPGDATDDLRVVVLDATDCELRLVQSFPAPG